MTEGFSFQLSEASPLLSHLWIFPCSLSTARHHSACKHQPPGKSPSSCCLWFLLFIKLVTNTPHTECTYNVYTQQLLCLGVANPVTPRCSQEMQKQRSQGW